jgi:hypothetical protein
MNAWIDSMPDLQPMVLQIDHIDWLPVDIHAALVDCAAFINWRCVESGEPTIITLSYHKTNR